MDDARLDRMIEEATVDANGPEEEAVGFYEILRQKVPVPFRALTLGGPVEVTDFDVEGEDVLVVCHGGGGKGRLRLADIILAPPFKGWRWIMAYFRFYNRSRGKVP